MGGCEARGGFNEGLGEGEVIVHVDERGVARGVEYRFTEAPRFFKYIVKGVHYTQVPDLVSRICGLCGISYLLCAARVFESCLDVSVPESVEAYRELVYLAESEEPRNSRVSDEPPRPSGC